MVNPCVQCKTPYKDCSHDCRKYDEWIEFRDKQLSLQCNKHVAGKECSFQSAIHWNNIDLGSTCEFKCGDDPCVGSR